MKESLRVDVVASRGVGDVTSRGTGDMVTSRGTDRSEEEHTLVLATRPKFRHKTP